MTIKAAPTHVDGYDFVAVLVRDGVLANPRLRDQVLDTTAAMFERETVLVGERGRRTYGSRRAVMTLGRIDTASLPWQDFQALS